jgi:flagellar protein FliL
MKKLLPVLIAVLGILGGTGAGYVLRPSAGADPAAEGDAHAPATDDHAPAEHAAEAPAEGHDEAPAEEHAATPDAHAAEAAPAHEGEDGEHSNLPDYVKLSNQFVVPVVEDGRVAAMVILSLTLEVPPGSSEAIYSREPKLRDAFLQVLFDHANAGGFRGAFTDGANLVILRTALREVARKIMAEGVSDVLIADIVRQDN